jgi:ubiquinone/menaquinone biosynthesis C-methylase UbiE
MDYKDLQAGHIKNNCWFKAKNNLIGVLIEKACRNRRQLKILGIGAGTGDDLVILNKYGKNYVIDIDKNALSVVDDKLCEEKIVADACDLPYSNSFFDVVVSSDVFEHISNDKKSVSEAYRVLKENGILIFTVPSFQFLFSSHDNALHHQRRYNKKSVRNLLSQFELKIFFWNSLLFLPIAIMRILKRNSKPKVDQMNLPSWLNTIFFSLLIFDNFLIKRGLSMPVGLSIVGLGIKR